MKTKAICSFFVLFAIVAGIGATTPAAFADHTEVTITPVAGSGVPGCEDTAEGCWTPNTATVDVGEKVIFSNTDTAAHTFTAGTPSDGPSEEFDTSLLSAGDSFEWTADTAGEIAYFCMIHPWMQGLIIVQEAEAEEEVMMEEETIEEEVMEETIEEEVMMEEETIEEEVMIEISVTEEEGGGCLIATATFGSEMAPQVQQLRELRDNTILSTESGTAFMTGLNQFYYSFSPAIADLE